MTHPTDDAAHQDLGSELDPFDFVEPCEPECSPERHAYHQGQWDMAVRMTGQDYTKPMEVFKDE